MSLDVFMTQDVAAVRENQLNLYIKDNIYLEDPEKARGRSINTFVVNSFIN